MAAISSAADGTWIAGAATTWVGGVAPAEGDTVTILNGHDVEIDGDITVGADSATAAIQVNSGGSLFVSSTVAGNYTLTLKGDLKTDATGGTISFGTAANPIPNTRTFAVKTNYSASLADGKYGLIIAAGGTFNCQGSDRWSNGLTDPDRTLLAADAAANATSVTAADSTAWLADDRIYIAPTSRTYTQYDPVTTNAGQVNSVVGTTINLKNFGGTGGGLTNAHAGTSPTQAAIINLTRNIIIQNYDGGPGAPGNVGYVQFATTATVDCDWTEFRYLGTNSANKYGITIQTTSGSCNINRCSIHTGECYGIRGDGATINNITIQNNVLARVSTLGNTAAIYIPNTSETSWTVTNNWVLADCYHGFYIQDLGGTYTYNLAAGVQGYGHFMGIGTGANIHGITGTFSNLKANSCATGGVYIANHEYGIYDTINCWRNNAEGLTVTTSGNISVNNYTGTANANNNILISTSGKLKFTGLAIAGDATYATGIGIACSNINNIYIYNSTFGVAAGSGANARVAHSTADIKISASSGSRTFGNIFLNNCTLASATEVDIAYGLYGTYVRASKHDGTAGVTGERFWSPHGTIVADTAYYNTASPSIKMSPLSTTFKHGDFNIIKIPVASGNNPTISVYFRKSASYNGSQPRLIVKRNDALGITADTVMATSAAAVDVDVAPGTFTQLSGQPGAVSADGVLEVYMDCDGTGGGYINLDDWSVTGNI